MKDGTRLSKRTYAAALTAIALLLGGVVVYDVYEDATVQGEPIGLTLAENSVPLVLVGGVLYATAVLYRRVDRESMATITRWTAIGVVGILVLAAWVFGIQQLQGTTKPLILGAQAAIGGAVGGVFVGYNVARVREARAESERERRRFESLFANTPTGIADLSVEGDSLVVERANRTFEAWFCADDASDDEPAAGETQGTAGRQLSSYVDLSGVDVDLARHVQTDRDLTTDITAVADGTIRYYTLQVVPYAIGDDQHRGYAILTDVTDQKETARQLQETVADLERSNEQLEQFAYVASHDLQEPLRMVSSYVELLASEYADELDEEADEYVRYAVDGAGRMQAMIDGLLEYSRVQTRGEEFTPTDADAVLERTRRDLALLIEEADATVTSDTLPTVTADESQLGQLFQNLLKNAIDHGGDAPEIHVGVEERADDYVFSVADDGPGIPADQQDRMFEIFEQGSRDGGGTGMGLAICDRIVARHDGDIWVESDDGDGATFFFSLPKA